MPFPPRTRSSVCFQLCVITRKSGERAPPGSALQAKESYSEAADFLREAGYCHLKEMQRKLAGA